ncbi:MAG: hypothetical protein ACOVLG_05695 [Flavobacterium sp.]
MKLVKEKDINQFDNSQMLVHFGKIHDRIKLNSKDIFSIDFYGKVIEIDSELIKSVITYHKLKKKYRIESEILLDEIISRMGIEYSHISKSYLKEFFDEIYKKIKYIQEKDRIKRKIVWLKK